MAKPNPPEPKTGIDREPGLRHVKTTNAFRIVNFELFAKPVRLKIQDCQHGYRHLDTLLFSL